MARADIILSIVKSGIANDSLALRKAIEALAADERSKNHHIFADRLNELLSTPINHTNKTTPFIQNGARDLVFEVMPEKRFSDLVLERNVLEICEEVIEEHHRADLLGSYGLEPRHRFLFVGPRLLSPEWVPGLSVSGPYAHGCCRDTDRLNHGGASFMPVPASPGRHREGSLASH